MKCKAVLSIGDDYGDNSCTMHCQLDKRHAGSHFETYINSTQQKVVVTWSKEKAKKNHQRRPHDGQKETP